MAVKIMTQTPITHVIFDMDGVLLNTEIFYTEATQQIVQRYGKTLDWDTKARMIGRQASVAAQVLIESLALPITVEAYLQERNTLLDRLFPRAEAMPGAVEFTRYLQQHAIPYAIATSAPNAAFSLKMQQHQAWLPSFAAVVRGDDPGVKAYKPAPDIFLAAAHAMQARPEQCLVFEDSPAGIAAARAAKMPVIALIDERMDPAIYAAADAQITHFSAFQPSAWGLPPR
jgi:pseudouridine-5'-monophosphatase